MRRNSNDGSSSGPRVAVPRGLPPREDIDPDALYVGLPDGWLCMEDAVKLAAQLDESMSYEILTGQCLLNRMPPESCLRCGEELTDDNRAFDHDRVCDYCDHVVR
jgi:hypothetical protein